MGSRDSNPAVGVELASGKRPKARVWTAKAVARWKVTGERPGPVMVWPPSLAGAFLDYAQAHDIVLYAMYLLIPHRALRLGEACGLRDHDVDLDNARLRYGGADMKEVQETLGHSTIALTADTYTAVILDLQHENADAIADLIPRDPPQAAA